MACVIWYVLPLGNNTPWMRQKKVIDDDALIEASKSLLYYLF